MNIAEVQLVRKGVLAVAILAGVLMYALTNSTHPSGQTTHEMIEWVGIVAIVICIVGRTWCTLYIGGRKIDQFVTEGPYSVSRNPLYCFSILGAAGTGAQLGSVVVSIVFGALAWIVFYVVVLQEERLLATPLWGSLCELPGHRSAISAQSAALARRRHSDSHSAENGANLRRRDDFPAFGADRGSLREAAGHRRLAGAVALP